MLLSRVRMDAGCDVYTAANHNAVHHSLSNFGVLQTKPLRLKGKTPRYARLGLPTAVIIYMGVCQFALLF
jgi:hypothetical protein